MTGRKKQPKFVQQNRMAVQACLGCKTPGAQACRLRLTVRCKNSSFSTALDRAHLAALGPATNVFEKQRFFGDIERAIDGFEKLEFSHLTVRMN